MISAEAASPCLQAPAGALDGSRQCPGGGGNAPGAYRIAPDGDLTNPDGRFEQAVGIGAQGALLLRPDGVIGWRTRRPHPDTRTRGSMR